MKPGPKKTKKPVPVPEPEEDSDDEDMSDSSEVSLIGYPYMPMVSVADYFSTPGTSLSKILLSASQ